MNQRMHIPFSGFFGMLLLTCLAYPPLSAQEVYDTPLKAVDHFFETVGQSGAKDIFSEKAVITALRYDSLGNPSYLPYTPTSFDTELANLHQAFEVSQEPVVIVYREYFSVASIFCSVWSRFVDRSTSDTLISRSVQSFKLVRVGNGWKINHLIIQNESPAYPLANDMWPPEITSGLTAESGPALAVADTAFATYDPSRVYTPAEVDEPPVYPGTPKAFDDLLRASNVQVNAAPGYSPFTVIIAEDGGASLDNTTGLSNYQRAKAETFTRSMLVWYPAILDAASVKCKLTFYILE